jgi:hypothetical protein
VRVLAAPIETVAPATVLCREFDNIVHAGDAPAASAPAEPA